MVEKKTTKVAAEKKETAAKKTAVKKTCAKKAEVALNAENVGFKAGDVYQALAANGAAMTVKEIAKAAKIAEEDELSGLEWLFRDGKGGPAEGRVTLG